MCVKGHGSGASRGNLRVGHGGSGGGGGGGQGLSRGEHTCTRLEDILGAGLKARTDDRAIAVSALLGDPDGVMQGMILHLPCRTPAPL